MVNFWSILTQAIGERCTLCGAAAAGLCAACTRDLPRNGAACPLCAAALPDAADPAVPCGQCQRHTPAFAATIAALVYRPPVDRLIAALKYRHELRLARPLAHCLIETIHSTRDPTNAWPQQLIPVPMSPDRLRQRGFNQAQELGRIVARALDIPLAGGIVARPGGTPAQRGLSKAARRRNVRGAFEVRRAPAPRIAIIDDVMTTGSTADSLSTALRAAGAESVEVWVVGRTPAPDDAPGTDQTGSGA